jgi:proteic killer suppression protein
MRDPNGSRLTRLLRDAQRAILAHDPGRQAGIQPHHAKQLPMQLVALDTAQIIDDMNIAGFRLHPLKGEEKGRWSIWVNGNWRLTFEFRDGHEYVLDYEDYH